MVNPPLVSILIPTYNSPFFEPALLSALNQTYQNTEIIVGDDSENDHAERVVKKHPNAKLRYIRNAVRLGFHGNFANCFEQARGEYIKFLNHDDLLHPDCAAAMVRAFEVGGSGVTLVTSSRLIIDDKGEVQAGRAVTEPLSNVDCAIGGFYLGDLALSNGMNFIGEPTTAMFRKADVDVIDGSLFRIGDRQYLCLADLCLWLRLLAKGKAIYLVNPLSCFREHDAQLQTSTEGAALCIVERLYLPVDARTIGFLKDDAAYRMAIDNATGLIRKYHDMQGGCEADRVVYAQALKVAGGIV